MNNDILSILRQLDFTEYEAKAYLALLKDSPLSGYAVALHSGVPRSKIYEVLSNMEEQGKVIASHESTTLYTPLPPLELLAQRKRYTEKCFNIAEKALENYSSVLRRKDNIWDITGYETIINQARGIIDKATNRILLEISSEEANILKENLQCASQRGVEITIVAFGNMTLDFAHILRHDSKSRIYTEFGGRWIILSVDDNEVLAGIVSLGADSRAATTTHPGLVMPITEEIIHDIYIGEILSKHRDILEDSFGPELINLRKKYHVGSEAIKQWLSTL